MSDLPEYLESYYEKIVRDKEKKKTESEPDKVLSTRQKYRLNHLEEVRAQERKSYQKRKQKREEENEE